jgi:hypothetical protein
MDSTFRQNPFRFIFPWLRILSYLAGFPVKIVYTGTRDQVSIL